MLVATLYSAIHQHIIVNTCIHHQIDTLLTVTPTMMSLLLLFLTSSLSLSLPPSIQLSSILMNKVLKPGSYHEAKQAAGEYHEAKQALIKAFHKAGLGAWVKKPIEQDQFTLSS